MAGLLNALLGRRRPVAKPQRRHLKAEEWPAVIYAVGDVHGCLAQLSLLQQRIIADGAAIAGEKWVVFLGDYVDRGPNSAGVLDALLAPLPDGFRRITLAGNHEIMMLDFLETPSRNSRWLEFGGDATLQSYGLNARELMASSERERSARLRSHIPDEHIDFLRNLPLTLSIPGIVFVHAGLQPGVSVEQQVEADVLWIRDEFFVAPPVPGRLVVHGHTPGPEPVSEPGRICVDTGAFATGVLTAVRLEQNRASRFMSNT